MTTGFYMHKHAMDVCIEIYAIERKDSGAFLVEFDYWNLGYVGKPFLQDVARKEEIRAEDVGDWVKLTPRQMRTKRLRPGIPIGDSEPEVTT